MTAKPRENVLVETAREFFQLFNELKEEFDSIDSEFDFLRDFFDSYLSSYSLSLAYPEELWKVTAQNMGIDPEGKDRLQLAREIFYKSIAEEEEIKSLSSQPSDS